jgi:oligopeptide transport system ATP-binding protein
MSANVGAGMAGTNKGFEEPKIKGKLRLRPNGHIQRARSILLSIPIMVVGLAVGALLLSVVFREPAAGIGSLPDKPGIVILIWPGYVVSAFAFAATKGFRDRRRWSLAVAAVVGIVLVGGAVFLFLSTTNAPATSGVTPTASGAVSSPAATVAATEAAATPDESAAAGASPGASGGAVNPGLASATKLAQGNQAFGVDVLAFLFIILGGPLLWNLYRGRSWFLTPEAAHEVLTAEHIEQEAGGLSPIVAPLTEIASGTYTEAKIGEPLLSVRGLKKHFPILGGVLRRRIGTIYAVDGVDFDVRQGEVFAVVGESGCGKTTLGRTLLQLTPPTAGHVIYDGYELGDVDPDDMRPLRRRMQIIFQDPFGSLNPRMPVSDIIGEGLLAQGVTNRAERDKRVEDSLEVVGLRRDYTRRYPHEFSGGQRQRIGIARALALSPDFIVCDEPVSALDVSIQSQVLNLLLDLKRDFNLTYMFISHNLSVVEYFSDRIAVMYLGRIVELGTVDQLYRNARHPYTVALLSAIPDADPRKRRRRLVLKGDVPSPAAPPSGCRFHTRCWLYEQLGKPERCTTEDPSLRVIESTDHQAACHFAEEVSETTVRETVATQDVIDTAAAVES